MNNYTLVIDISSDKENQRSSTPTEMLPFNMVGRLDLSDSSEEVWNGSEADLNTSSTSVSTFESEASPRKLGVLSAQVISPENTAPNEKGETFIVEGHEEESSKSRYFEEPDSLRAMPPLQPAPFLKDITNVRPTSYVPPTKVNKLNDLSDDELSFAEIEEVWGLNLRDSPTAYPQTRRGNYTSAKVQRLTKQSVTVVKEIPHCSGLPAFRARGALSRPAPGRNFTCCSGIPAFARGRGQGSIKYF